MEVLAGIQGVGNVAREPKAAGVDVRALVAQIGRAVRALVAQRGGIMLLRPWGGGATVRVECTLSGSVATVVMRCEDDRALPALRSSTERVRAACARGGCVLGDVEASGPAQHAAA